LGLHRHRGDHRDLYPDIVRPGGPEQLRENGGTPLKRSGVRPQLAKAKLSPMASPMLDYLMITLVFALSCSAVLVFIRLGG
jgi:hypothetical protein